MGQRGCKKRTCFRSTRMTALFSCSPSLPQHWVQLVTFYHIDFSRLVTSAQCPCLPPSFTFPLMLYRRSHNSPTYSCHISLHCQTTFHFSLLYQSTSKTLTFMHIAPCSIPTILGGIGGGGIMVPMLVSVGGFSVHHAIPLTQATVFGAAVMNLVQNSTKRHPGALLSM